MARTCMGEAPCGVRFCTKDGAGSGGPFASFTSCLWDATHPLAYGCVHFQGCGSAAEFQGNAVLSQLFQLLVFTHVWVLF